MTLRDKFREVNEDFRLKYGNNYPSLTDKEGWEQYGILQGLAYALLNEVDQ
jgi:hypothetical protein